MTAPAEKKLSHSTRCLLLLSLALCPIGFLLPSSFAAAVCPFLKPHITRPRGGELSHSLLSGPARWQTTKFRSKSWKTPLHRVRACVRACGGAACLPLCDPGTRTTLTARRSAKVGDHFHKEMYYFRRHCRHLVRPFLGHCKYLSFFIPSAGDIILRRTTELHNWCSVWCVAFGWSFESSVEFGRKEAALRCCRCSAAIMGELMRLSQEPFHEEK